MNTSRNTSRRFTFASALTLMTLATASPLAMAQKAENEPLPPPVVPMAGPEDIAKWAKAYQRAGRPKTLILVGWDSPVRPGRESVLELLQPDSNGVAERFRVGLSRVLSQPEMRFREVDPIAIADARERLGTALSARNEREGIDLLANTADAELVILVKLLGTRGQAPQTVLVQPIDYSQGLRMRPLPPMDWAPKGFGVDDQTIVDNMNTIARAFFSDYERSVIQASDARDYTLRVFGLSSEQLPVARRSLKAITGVDNFQDASVSIGAADSMAEFEVGFKGAPGDFREAVQQALSSFAPGLEAIPFKGEGGTLNMRIRARASTPTLPPSNTPVAAQPCDLTLTDPSSPAGLAARAELSKLYQRKGSPRVAVLVNRAPNTAAELAAAGSKVADSVVVVQTGASPSASPVGTGEEFRTLAELDRVSLDLETRIYDRLGTRLLNLTRSADPGRVRAAASAAAAPGQVVTAADVEAALRASNLADLYLIARGSASASQDGLVRTRWVFRAVDSSGRLLATASDLAAAVAPGLPAGASLDPLADQALAKLFCEVMTEWSKPTSARLALLDITDPADLAALRSALSASNPSLGLSLQGEPTIDLSSKETNASTTLQYTCTLEEAISELARLAPALPYRLELLRSSPEELRYRIIRR